MATVYSADDVAAARSLQIVSVCSFPVDASLPIIDPCAGTSTFTVRSLFELLLGRADATQRRWLHFGWDCPRVFASSVKLATCPDL